jgi:hypothetical protein
MNRQVLCRTNARPLWPPPAWPIPRHRRLRKQEKTTKHMAHVKSSPRWPRIEAGGGSLCRHSGRDTAFTSLQTINLLRPAQPLQPQHK